MREVSEIEARLKRHRDDNRYIDNQIERLETLYSPHERRIQPEPVRDAA